MKRSLIIALLTSSALLSAPSVSQASFGCEVLLCLAASGGTPSECRPPLKRLYKRLAKGKSFPSCKMESGPSLPGANGQATLPKPERGIAVYVPRHQVCRRWEYKSSIREDGQRYCADPKIIEEHYDHSGKSCSAWFPGEHFGNQHDGNRQLRQLCRSKSKRWVRVTGDGIEGEYNYY